MDACLVLETFCSTTPGLPVQAPYIRTLSANTVLTREVCSASQVVAPSAVSHSPSTLKEKWKKVQWGRSNR